MSEPQHPTRVHVTYQGADDPHAAREAAFASAYEALTGRPASEFTHDRIDSPPLPVEIPVEELIGPARPQLVRLTFQVDGCTCAIATAGTRQPHALTDRCPPCLVEEYVGGAWRPVG